MAPKTSVQSLMGVWSWVSVKCKCLGLFLSCGILSLAPFVGHIHLFHTRLSSLCMQLLHSKYIYFFSFLYCISLIDTLEHTHASYSAVIVDRKFMAHSSVPGVPGPLKYPPPPTITAHSNQPKLQQSGAWETLRSAIFLQSSCGEATSCAVVFLRLLTQPTPEWRPLQGLVRVYSLLKLLRFLHYNISVVPFKSHVIF